MGPVFEASVSEPSAVVCNKLHAKLQESDFIASILILKDNDSSERLAEAQLDRKGSLVFDRPHSLCHNAISLAKQARRHALF